jgi:hypothetical protein
LTSEQNRPDGGNVWSDTREHAPRFETFTYRVKAAVDSILAKKLLMSQARLFVAAHPDADHWGLTRRCQKI